MDFNMHLQTKLPYLFHENSIVCEMEKVLFYWCRVYSSYIHSFCVILPLFAFSFSFVLFGFKFTMPVWNNELSSFEQV